MKKNEKHKFNHKSKINSKDKVKNRKNSQIVKEYPIKDKTSNRTRLGLFIIFTYIYFSNNILILYRFMVSSFFLY